MEVSTPFIPPPFQRFICPSSARSAFLAHQNKSTLRILLSDLQRVCAQVRLRMNRCASTTVDDGSPPSHLVPTLNAFPASSLRRSSCVGCRGKKEGSRERKDDDKGEIQGPFPYESTSKAQTTSPYADDRHSPRVDMRERKREKRVWGP
jgi:hypothetical protein